MRMVPSCRPQGRPGRGAGEPLREAGGQRKVGSMTQAPQPAPPAALAGIRICDFCGQLAGAGATKWLAAFGAEVIRIEDPTRDGRWDILRGIAPFVDER